MSEEEAVKKRWYVVQAYSQYESRVKKTLLEYIKMHNMEDYFGQVLVPTEEVVEMRAGQKRKSERKFYPGYVLVEMAMTEESWHLVKKMANKNRTKRKRKKKKGKRNRIKQIVEEKK